MADDTKLCQNCKRDISVANFVMHEVHCRRHIILCQDCNEPVPKAELDQHFNELHVRVPCQRCNKDIPKDAMVKHLAEECHKKLIQCTYCDLSVTKDELESHMGYCGSRTECCSLCQQYIMLKDMLRHESSGCTYPEPKPAPQQQPLSDPGMFSMEELQQLLSSPEYGAPDLYADRGRDLLFSYDTKTNFSPLIPVSNDYNTSSSYKADINLHKDKKRPSELSDSGPAYVDYDALLALQLAQEWQQADIDGDLALIQQNLPEEAIADVRGNQRGPDSIKSHTSRSTVNELPQPSLRHNEDHYTDDDDEAKIPCEFCELEVSLNAYCDHVENCQVSRFLKQSHNPNDLNNETSSPRMSLSRHSIPVINNLRSLPRGEFETPKLSSSNGNVILPCEFCEELFPSEMIIQHESICPMNELNTHQEVSSLVASNSRDPHPAARKRSVRSVPSPTMPVKSSRSRPRRQPSPPLINYAGQDGGDADDSVNFSKKPSTVTRPLESTSNNFDPAVTKPPRRLSRHNSHGDEDAPDVVVSKHELRTRAKLNQFLQEEVDLGASAYTKEEISHTKPGRSSGQERMGVDRKVTVDSRTVLRQMEDRSFARQSEDNKQVSSSRKRSSQRSQLPDENNGQTPAARNHQRAHNVFSPELRLKPDSKLPPKKR